MRARPARTAAGRDRQPLRLRNDRIRIPAARRSSEPRSRLTAALRHSPDGGDPGAALRAPATAPYDDELRAARHPGLVDPAVELDGDLAQRRLDPIQRLARAA